MIYGNFGPVELALVALAALCIIGARALTGRKVW